MRGQRLPTNAISTGVRVDKAVLQDDWHHVVVDMGDHSCLLLFDLLELQVLRQVNDLWTIKRELHIQVGMHLFLVASDEEVLVI